MFRMFAAAALIAAASAGPASAQPHPSEAGAWEIGPIVRARNLSVGMPRQPSPARRGWSFDFPYPSVGAGHVHYLTFVHGPLTGRRRIEMRYRIDAAPGVRFVPRESPDQPAVLSLYFQRAGDTWSGRGRYETYRWYAPERTIVPLTPGEHVVSVPLDEAWISVAGRTAAADRAAWREALDETGRVGFVLGWPLGRGHGVYATGPARMTVLSFRII